MPGRGENGKICISEKFAFLMNSSVFLNSSSVSPGNPMMRSAVIALSGKLVLSDFMAFFAWLVLYFLFILWRVSSQPLCKEMWKWLHMFGISFSFVMKSSVSAAGSSEPRRSLAFGAAVWMVWIALNS